MAATASARSAPGLYRCGCGCLVVAVGWCVFLVASRFGLDGDPAEALEGLPRSKALSGLGLGGLAHFPPAVFLALIGLPMILVGGARRRRPPNQG